MTMLRVQQVKLPVEAGSEELRKAVSARLRVSPDRIRSLSIERRALDARRKPSLYFVYTVLVTLADERRVLKKHLPSGVRVVREEPYRFPKEAKRPPNLPPVIIGSGPAGLFCAYMLASHGYTPTLLERGDAVDRRSEKVDAFWQGGALDPESNVQFGEGGAGTFSDGKLYTGVRDPAGRNAEVLRILVEAGAPEEILYEAHAHLGTDLLRDLVRMMREQIEAMGGRILFRKKATEFMTTNGVLSAIRSEDGDVFPTSAAVLAIGHSARDTFRILTGAGIAMEAKPFAVGLRIQHPQEVITLAQYGPDAPEFLGAASYKVQTRTSSGRNAYSFCMCPGGMVINASSEQGRLAVNGMSLQARDSGYANSAIVTGITPVDCASLIDAGTDPVFAGMHFQEELEKKAFQLADGAIPAQSLSAFREKRLESALPAFPCTGGVARAARVDTLLPGPLSDAVREGIDRFGTMIEHFDAPETLLFGIESRTSSPVRIVRDASLQSSLPGLFPCGEGAGYAGGILSAAIDGIRVAEAVAGYTDI